MKQQIDSITIGIPVSHVTAAKAWYNDLLGDIEVMEPVPGTVEMKLADNVWLQLDDTGYLEQGSGSIIRFETKDIQAAYERAKALSPDVTPIETVEGVIRYFDFKDPSGNKLSYVQLL